MLRIVLQTYLKVLLKAANSKRAAGDALAHARVGVRCLASLLASLHHFNYASDLLQVGRQFLGKISTFTSVQQDALVDHPTVVTLLLSRISKVRNMMH